MGRERKHAPRMPEMGQPERLPLSLSGRPAHTQHEREHWNMLKSGLVLAEARITGHAVGGARLPATAPRGDSSAPQPFRFFSSLLFLF